MRQLITITSRNLKQYLRDRGAVFFSLLSMLIVIALMVFFLGDMNVESITDALAGLPGRDAAQDEKNATQVVLSWTCAGILSINAVTVTLGCLSCMIKDRTSGKLSSIYTAPVSRTIIGAGYILAAWISSVIICTLTLGLTEVYCISQGMTPYTFSEHVQLIGMIAANSFTYASLMYLIATLVSSEGAWSGLGTVIGTLVGFLGGIYLPIGALSDTIGSLMKCTPVIYGTAMFRKLMCKSALEQTFSGAPAQLVAEYREVMGIDLSVGETLLGISHEVAILLLCGVVFTILSTLILRFGKKHDR